MYRHKDKEEPHYDDGTAGEGYYNNWVAAAEEAVSVITSLHTILKVTQCHPRPTPQPHPIERELRPKLIQLAMTKS